MSINGRREVAKEIRPPVAPEDDRIGKAIVDAAFAVHSNLWPGTSGKCL